MNIKRLIAILFIAATLFISKAVLSDEDAIAKLNSSFKRTESHVMIRVISQPALANLDFSAYDRNPMFHRPEAPKLNPPQNPPSISDLNFGGTFSSIYDRIEQTPLTKEEKANPMAWNPMVDFLADWDYDQAMELMVAGMNVSKEKWGNSTTLPLQKIATAYITKNNEIWVKIEFEPCVDFLKDIDDEDADGYREIYALIDKSKYSDKLLNHLKSEYMKKELSDQEVKDYFYELSAKWYEAVKTETLDMETQKTFPTDKTEPEIIKELDGLRIDNATAIIRGNPYGSSIYNIFIAKKNSKSSNINRINDELKQYGDGNWEKWAESLAGFRQDVEQMLKDRPAEIKGFIGKDGQLFFRGSLEYLTTGDLRKQDNERDPYPAIVDYKRQLGAKGIDFLFVIIPAKTEIYPDKVSDKANPDSYVTPYTRKLILELEESGVEVVDLLPALIDARKQDEAIYMPLDTHWSDSGLRLSAKIIGDRIKEYLWYNEVCPDPIQYKTKEVEFTRGGDIRGMIPDDEKIKYRPMSLVAQQVLNPNDSFYEDDPSSPIVVLGDSFCGVFQVEEPKHAGLSSHIAKEIGMPVDLMVAYGSGPGIRKRFARRGSEAIAGKKLVIWTTAARDLYNYWSPWDIVKVP